MSDTVHRTLESDSGPRIDAFYDRRTSTLTYVVSDPQTRDAVVIDPVLDYEPRGSKLFTESVDAIIAFLNAHDLDLLRILETHAHADHLSGAQHLREHFPDATLAVGARITEVQALFARRFDLPDSFPTDGRQFDELLQPGQPYTAGSLAFEVIATPGHTPACVTYRFGDAIFTGDALFMPDQGTGRCDFPGGSADDMYDSIQRLYALPPETRVLVGHDYQPGGRALAFESTIAEQRAHNVQLRADTPRQDFVERREARDATLAAPALLFQSIQVNIDAGRLPDPAANEVRYLRIPINIFRPPADPELLEVESV